MARAPTTTERPSGLEYRPDFLTEAEERQALGVIEPLDFYEVAMRGQVARRTVRHFGLRYGYEDHELTPTDPFPAALAWLQERCAELARVEPEQLVEVLVTRYPPGAPIGWHRDAPMFGKVVGVSLAASARMRFQRRVGDERRVFELDLAPRSAYLLAGSVRWAWQHSIPPTKALRYSVTFRTLHPRRTTGFAGA